MKRRSTTSRSSTPDFAKQSLTEKVLVVVVPLIVLAFLIGWPLSNLLRTVLH